MHDYILIQSTQLLFCKAVASYPSGGAGHHGILLSSIAIPARISTAWHCDGHSD